MNDEDLLRKLAEDVERKDLEAIVAKCHPEVEFEPLIGQIEGGVYRGHDAIRDWWEQREQALDIALSVVEIRRVAAAFMLKATMSARGHESGAPVIGDLFVAMSVREGQLDWWAVFQDEESAMRRARERSEGG